MRVTSSRPIGAAVRERWSVPATTVVTGAGGWLGRALVDRLLADPTRRHLRLLAHDRDEAALLPTDDRVSVVTGDVADPATLEQLFDGAGPDTDVVHAAGVIHPARVRDFYAVNTLGTKSVVEVARRSGIRRLVHVSSNSPFGTNPHPGDRFRVDEPYRPYYGYGHSKMLAELAVLDAVGNGLDATIVRPPWFYGPFQPPRQTTFFRMVRAGRFPVIGGGHQMRSMVYVGNLVDGVLAAELTPQAHGRAYWIADARPYEVNEIVATVGRALRDEGFSVKDSALRLPGPVGRLAETGDRLIQRLGLYQQQLHVLGEMDKNIACDISAARDELGYEPAMELYDGMRASIRWCVEQGLEL